MFGTLKGRIILILAVVALAIGALVKNHGVKEGLDLQGGMYLSLEVSDPNNTMTKEARKDATDQALEVIRNRIDQFGVSEPLIQKVGDDRIVVQLPGIRDEQRAKGIIQRTAFLEFRLVKPERDFIAALDRMDQEIVRSGAAPATPATADTTKAKTQSPMDLLFKQQRDSARAKGDTTAATDSATEQTLPSAGDKNHPLGGLLMQSGSPGELLVAESDVATASKYLALPEVQRLLPRGTQLFWGAKASGRGAQLYRSLYILDTDAFMKGSALEDAQAGRDQQFGQTIVTFQLNRRGGRTRNRHAVRRDGRPVEGNGRSAGPGRSDRDGPVTNGRSTRPRARPARRRAARADSHSRPAQRDRHAGPGLDSQG